MTISHYKTLIYNANIYTCNDELPKATSMIIENGKISALFTTNHEIEAFDGITIDASGQTILPGFIDAHCHLNAMVADAFAWNCPAGLTTLEQFIAHLKQHVADVPEGQWIRINRFNPAQFIENRLLTKDELDRISTTHPIRIRHVSRHATMLNTMALHIALKIKNLTTTAGIKINLQHGILYGADAFLNTFVVPRISQTLRYQQVPHLQQQLLSYGITAVQDATPTTTLEDVQFWRQAIANGWPIHTRFMANIDTFKKNNLSQIPEVNTLKVVIEHLPELYPNAEQLTQILHYASEHQITVAIHAVTPEMMWMIIDCVSNLGALRPPLIRIEHASLCPKAFIPLLTEHGIHIVTNPNFIYEHGDRYLKDVEKSEHPWIYLTHSFHEEDIIVSAGSDAPVATVNPFIGIYAACTRLTKKGQLVNQPEQLTRLDAWKLYTKHAARVTHLQHEKGQLAVGFDADFLITAQDPFDCPIEQLLEMTAISTWIGGTCVYPSFKENGDMTWNNLKKHIV